MDRLTASAISRAQAKGLYPDGGGLYLQVGPSGSKSWVFRFMLNGRAREMGLGPLHTISLAEARQLALTCRKQKLAGIDPIEARHLERRVALVASASAPTFLPSASARTFAACADAFIKAHQADWRNRKHSAQWRATLKAYADPIIGGLSVQSISVGHVMKVLEPIWKTKPETASRLRGRIEAVLDWAASRGYRQGDNPARWRGNLSNLLPKHSSVKEVRHYPALPYVQLGAFIKTLREQEGIAATALEFLILTASRTTEVIGARWGEINLRSARWTIPADRASGGKEHPIPLSAPALAIIRRQSHLRHGAFIFPGGKRGKPLSNNALLALLKRMGRGDITAQGFRSTFRSWADERTNFPTKVVEMALGHAIGDKVEAARRGELFDQRRRLMAAWAKYCNARHGQ
jgi:integrase